MASTRMRTLRCDLRLNSKLLNIVEHECAADEDRNGIKYTYTGGHEIAHGGERADFDITPTEVFAVPVEG